MLDEVDAGIIAGLRGDGRATFQLLADLVGLSRTAVRSRLLALVTAGTVQVQGAVHPQVCGVPAGGHLLLQVTGPIEELLVACVAAVEDPAGPAAGAEARLRGRPPGSGSRFSNQGQRPPYLLPSSVWSPGGEAMLESAGPLNRAEGQASGVVTFAAATAGPADLYLKVWAPSGRALVRIGDRLRALPGVAGVRIWRTAWTAGTTALPADPIEMPPLDDRDFALLHLLQADARAPFTRLSQHIGLSQAATRARVVNLRRAQVFRTSVHVDPAEEGRVVQAGFGVTVAAPAGLVAEALGPVTGVDEVSVGIGLYDLMGQVSAADGTSLARVLDQVRQVTGVSALTTWPYLTVVRDRPVIPLIREDGSAPQTSPAAAGFAAM